jgi:hypothetical protein
MGGAQVAQRQRRAGLHLAQREAGVDVLHVGQLEQRVHGPAAVGVQVGGQHLQLEGAGAADVVAGHHLGQRADGVFQRPGGVGVVALGVHPHEGQRTQADLAAVDLGAVAGDDALRLQPLHPAPGGRGRQADAGGQLGVAEPGVLLQGVEDGHVIAVQRAARVLVSVGRVAQRFPGIRLVRRDSFSDRHAFGWFVALSIATTTQKEKTSLE